MDFDDILSEDLVFFVDLITLTFITFNYYFLAGPQCGGTLTNAEGTFASPNYPSPYNHDASCVWVISVHTGDQITLTFNAMNLESHANCGYDYVLVGTLFSDKCILWRNDFWWLV